MGPGRRGGWRTATNDLLLNPPLADDREQERQRVHDGHGQAQLCDPVSLAMCPYLLFGLGVSMRLHSESVAGV